MRLEELKVLQKERIVKMDAIATIGGEGLRRTAEMYLDTFDLHEDGLLNDRRGWHVYSKDRALWVVRSDDNEGYVFTSSDLTGDDFFQVADQARIGLKESYAVGDEPFRTGNIAMVSFDRRVAI